MAAYLPHATIEGERWDLLAWRYYGDALDYRRIIEANPQAPIIPVLPAGLILYIPVLAAADVAAPVSSALPPWLR